MFSIVVQLVAFFVEAGFSPLAAATAFGIVGLFSATSVMGSGLVAERFGYRQTVTASIAGTVSGMGLLIALTLAPSWFLLALFVPVFGFCMGVRGPIVSSVSARYFAGARAPRSTARLREQRRRCAPARVVRVPEPRPAAVPAGMAIVLMLLRQLWVVPTQTTLDPRMREAMARPACAFTSRSRCQAR
jgi:hypothetical protein